MAIERGWNFRSSDGFKGSVDKGTVHVSPHVRKLAAGGPVRGHKAQKHYDRFEPHHTDSEDVPDGMKDGGKWIKGAIKHPGALHKELGVPKDEKIPAKKLAAAAKKGGKEGKRARLAETLGRMHKADGGKIAKKDVHKHEKHLHKGEKMTKLARGGKAKKSRHSEGPAAKQAAGALAKIAQVAQMAGQPGTAGGGIPPQLQPDPGLQGGAPPMPQGMPPGMPPSGGSPGMRHGGKAHSKHKR